MTKRLDVRVRIRQQLLGSTGALFIIGLAIPAAAAAQAVAPTLSSKAGTSASETIVPVAGSTLSPAPQATAPEAPVPARTDAATDGSSSVATQSTEEADHGERAPDIVVTGSRVIRNGYQAPTPVSVLSAEALEAIAPTNIADAVNRLPALQSSITPRSQPSGITSGALGVNQLNLRSLGTNRTLVLLDGKRIVNSSAVASALYSFAAPDVNTVPNGLVSRVDVVTGGASAAYGSDALAGVVNFVLDRKFTGIKGTAQGGITTHGDDPNYLASLTFGQPFAGGRGHVLFSGEIAFNGGISGTPRDWNDNSAVVLVNPTRTATNGQPYLLLARQVGLNNGTPGGLITASPAVTGSATAANALRGIVFGQNGAPGAFNFGTLAANNVMTGGDWQYSRIDNGLDLDARQTRRNAFSRLSFDAADGIEFYAEGQYARSDANSTATPNRRLGNVTVRADNAFIPAAVAARVAALGLPSFTVGTTNGDIGRVEVANRRTLTRWTAGVDGKFGVLGSQWNYDAYYQSSRNVVISSASNLGVTARYLQAADAVRSPTTGAIVCRSTLSNPTDGCVPYNVMGTGVNDARAVAYVTGTARRRDVLGQDVAAFEVNGQPFSTWAGPVAVGFGFEHRKETLRGAASALDEANAFFTANYHASNGGYHVNEGFLEVAVPLAKETSWAESLDLNGAVRATDYSTSGYVTTYKIGAVYAPVSDIRFRGTHSRDIRAPSVGELFSAGNTTSGQALFDPFTNANLSNSFQLTIGNRNLKPEKADSYGIGVVVAPRFIPGLQGSVDYYDINIKGAVATPGAQTVIDLCFQGDTSFCQYITRAAAVGPAALGAITTVGTVPSNIQSQSTRGIDFDVSYNMPLSKISPGMTGNLRLSGMATYIISLKTNGTNGAIEGSGVLGSFTSLSVTALAAPKFKSTVSAMFTDDVFDATFTWRHIGGGVYANYLTSCASDCPANSTTTISDNRIGENNLFDIGFALRPFSDKRGIELFAAMDNVFDQDPPLIYGVAADGYYQGQANSLYDRIGRTVRAGLRFKM